MNEPKSELFKLSRLGDILKSWIDEAPSVEKLRTTLIDPRSAPTSKLEVIYTFDKLEYFSTVKTAERTRRGKNIFNLDIRFSNDGFLYPRDRDSGLEIIQSGISRHRDISDWSSVKKDSAKIHFNSFAELAANILAVGKTQVDLKVMFNYEAARIDIECTSFSAEGYQVNFYFEPGFPTRTFDPSIWDEK